MLGFLNSFSGDHDWRFVLLIGVVLLVGSFVGIELLNRVRRTRKRVRLGLIGLVGAAIAAAIWVTTHWSIPTAITIPVVSATLAILAVSVTGAFANRYLKERDLQLINAVNNMSHGLLMFDAAEKLVVCNDRYAEMYGLSRDVVKPGCTLADLLKYRIGTGTFTGDPNTYRNALLSALREGKIWSHVHEAVDGKAIAVTNAPLVSGGWIATHEDITERRRAEARIAHLAHHDALTDLPNRAFFNDRLNELLQRSTESDEGFALLCIDLDRFKEVNDVFGHGTGDRLLCEVSHRFRNAAADAFLARISGDEFSLLAPGAQPSTAAKLCEDLAAAVSKDFLVERQQLKVAISIGVAVFPSDGTDAATLVRNADAALYRAKGEGRGTMRFFEPEMDKMLRERRALQHDLQSALERHELSLNFQPQALVDGQVIGFEALLRWNHPEHGPIPPDTFIPLAEENGLIISIGEWVLREACREAASWSRPLLVAVNLSPIQMKRFPFPSPVQALS